MLPAVKYPLFPLTLPSTEETIFYRPYTINEEKTLLIAEESGDAATVMKAIETVVMDCVPQFKGRLSVFDIEYLMMHIRSKSVSNMADLVITDNETGEKVNVSIDVESVEIVRTPGHNKVIKADEEISLVLRYPSMDALIRGLKTGSDNSVSNVNLSFDNMLDSIETIVHGDQVYRPEDFPREELVKWFVSLSKSTLEDLKKFFETMPKIRYNVQYTLQNGSSKNVIIEGWRAFFT